MRTGAVYIRVSTDMQVELSPDSQFKMIQQYAKANDIIITDRFVYVDEGISGRKAEKRPAFMEMIGTAKLKPKPFDVILVWKFSRFARNREDSIVYKSMLKKECGIDVISISEPVGEDKTSILIEALLEAMDEYYSLNLAEEVRRGMTEKISRGGIVVAPPFGYSIENGVYVPDDNAKIVKMIFDKYLNGTGMRTIAQELNDMGIKTNRGNTFGNRNIEYILTNITYIGKLRWNPDGKATTSHKYVATEDTIIVDGHHEPIIDNDTFEAVQKLIAQHKAKYPKHHQQRRSDFYFRGIVRCSDCNATLTRVGTQTNEALQCHNYARGQCHVSHYITIAKLRNAVIDAIKEDINNIDNITVVPKNQQQKRFSNAEYAMITDKIEKEKMKLKRIKEAYEDGIDTLEEYKANKTKIMQSIEVLQQKLSTLPKTKKDAPASTETSIREALTKTYKTIIKPECTPEEFNSALYDIIDTITFDRKNNEISIVYKE